MHACFCVPVACSCAQVAAIMPATVMMWGKFSAGACHADLRARGLHLDVSLRRVAEALMAEVKEGKDIAVGIGDLKAPQPIVYERQLLYERRTALAELVEQRVGVEGIDVRVPTSPFVPGVIWLWKHVGRDRLEHDADAIPAHAGVVRIVGWTLEVEPEAEALDVVRDRDL